MRAAAIRMTLAAAAALAWSAGTAPAPSRGPTLKWYKGNLHTHTINSDGDSAPDAVARWYKEHRYNFLALTDHNYLTDPQGLNSFLAARDRFLLITGEEVTAGYEGAPVHVNALRLRGTIEPASGASVLQTLQNNVDRVRDAGAVPSLNHPFYKWAIDSQTFQGVSGLKLFEIFNGSPDTNDELGLERMWDAALSGGTVRYGIAVDDAHVFKRLGPAWSNPGRGWVEVQASELTQEAILGALDRGDFYASTGVKLESLERTAGWLRLRIAQQGDERFRIRFIGKGGRVLAEGSGPTAEYRLQPGDGYVRATVKDSQGRRAWVQPLLER